MATERNRGQQASKDPRLKSVVAGKEKLGKLVLVLGGQRLLTGKKFLEETAGMGMTEGLDLSPRPASGNTSPLCLH